MKPFSWQQAKRKRFLFGSQRNLNLFDKNKLIKTLDEQYYFKDLSIEKKLPDKKKAKEKILKIAKEIKLARQLERFKCPHNGCKACKPFEAIINGEAELVGKDNINRDVYVLRKNEEVSDGKVL